jgi:DNA-binding transcriptional MerR regulator
LTIDQLAAATGTTSRRIRSFQTLGLLPRPELRGRTGLYGPRHTELVGAILRLQQQGFSLDSLHVLFHAWARGAALADVLGLPASPEHEHQTETEHATDTVTALTRPDDEAELYGFAELEGAPSTRRRAGRPLLSVVPTTMWPESAAS